MIMKNYYDDKQSKFINEEELGSIFDLYDSYGFKTSLAKCRYSGGYYTLITKYIDGGPSRTFSIPIDFVPSVAKLLQEASEKCKDKLNR